MHRPLSSSLALGLSALALLAALPGCGSKPSCKTLYERLKECATSKGGPRSEEIFMKLCEKRKGEATIKERIACAAEKGCSKFQACLKRARQRERAALITERWKEIAPDLAKGTYNRLLIFCDVRKDELPPELKAKCEAIPGQAVAELTRRITAARDQGAVPLKGVSCWDLKKLAARVGPEARRTADRLCQEVEVARQLAETRAAVKKHLSMKRLFLPYHCFPARLDEAVRKVRSPYTERARGEMITLCLKQLGKVILEQRVPGQQRCTVRDVYGAIQTLGLKDPGLDPWMEKAKLQCEAKPAPDPAMAPAAPSSR